MIGQVNVPGASALDLEAVSQTAQEALEKAEQALTEGSVIKITFESAFVGATYTLTDGANETKTGTVPESCTVSVNVEGCNTTYTVSADYDGTTYSSSTTTGAYYGQYTLELERAHIYGASWDGTSSTSWTRTDESADFVDPVPYVSGASSYSSPFDDLQPWAGMTVSERTGGTMVSIPKFWYKIAQDGSGMKIQIADKEADGFSVSPAHMDRGDGSGERDVVYIGRYHCGSTAYKSVAGQSPKVGITRSTARSAISALGDNIWQMDFAMRFTIWLLYIVEFADWNSQAKIGYGCGDSGEVEVTGSAASMPYHTGTMQSSRTTYGVGVQYRYIEGLWDNCCDWMDGCYYNSSGMNIILNPSSFSDSSGGTSIGTLSSGYPKAFTVKSISGTFPTFIPTTGGGGASTYSCDYWSFDSSYPCLYVGGYCDQDTDYGLFYVDYDSTSYAGGSIGCRLQELP